MTMTAFRRVASEPYYLIHFFAFFSYIIVRCSAAELPSPLLSHLLRREIQLLLAFCVLTAVKFVREETWEAFVGYTLFYAKISLACIALLMDYHLALWYAIGFLVMYIITQQPAFKEQGTVNYLTPLQLETLLTEGGGSKFWMVEFRSLSTSSCVRSSSFFPELSITFSNNDLSFGTVDIGLFPNAAEKFGISHTTSQQLPTYVMFNDGVEVSRLTPWDPESNFFNVPLSKKLVCQHFQLDKLLIDYIHGK